jgi:hypothetical protein
MRVLVSTKNKLCLFWSPKAGCSTAAKIFLEHEGFPLHEGVWIHKERERYQAEVHPMKMPENPAHYAKIQFTRDPYQRSVCSYLLHLEHHRRSESIPFSRRGLEEFLNKKINGEIKCKHCNFHSSGQFMTNEIDTIIRIENLERDIERANSLFGLRLDPQNQYHPHSFRKRIDASGVSSKQVYDSLLDNPSIRKLIEKIYENDFEFLGRHSITS